MGEIEPILNSARPGYLRPLRFFPAWQGVLTLAFSGFPPSLKKLKKDINDTFNSIPKESPGSMWPKVTLGALRDSVRLTPEMLVRINSICSEVSSAFDTGNPFSKSGALPVTSLDIVMYACRSLERQISVHTVPLLGNDETTCDGRSGVDVDESAPSEEECSRVQAVVDEAQSPDYWFFASKDGNREAHYKSDALGVSLVHHLVPRNWQWQQQQQQQRHTTTLTKPSITTEHQDGLSTSTCPLLPVIERLRNRIDIELPGLYSWMPDSSLHCTFRALM